ncbi:hypothetical protein ACIOD2_42305 [Amycolatopsis sp. NPDC088138]|uniref:hypothetical protein n=1 Tax=Amycolatopsis sp. NPDC088138 TaxID=3363938 RepID=UPI00381807C6
MPDGDGIGPAIVPAATRVVDATVETAGPGPAGFRRRWAARPIAMILSGSMLPDRPAEHHVDGVLGDRQGADGGLVTERARPRYPKRNFRATRVICTNRA